MKKRVSIPIRVSPDHGKFIDGQWMIGWKVDWCTSHTYRAMERLNLLDMKLPGSAFDLTYVPYPEGDPRRGF